MIEKGRLSVECAESILSYNETTEFRPNSQIVYSNKEKAAVLQLNELPANDFSVCERK